MSTAQRPLVYIVSLFFLLFLAGCATHNTSIGTKIDDSAITAKVKSAFLADPTVKGTQVSVETVGGEVLLSGFVTSTADAARAVDIARRVEGVRAVINKMAVRP